MIRKRKFVTRTEHLVDYARTAGLEGEEYIQKWILASAVTGDERLTGELISHLQVSAAKELVRPSPYKLAREQELLQDIDPNRAVLFGHTAETGVPVLYPLDGLARHVFVVGSTGSGKSNLLHGTVLQTMRMCPVWSFDREKTESRIYLNWQPETLVLNARRDLAWNFCQPPPGVDPHEWLTAITVTFAKCHALMDASEGLLHKVLTDLYGEFGVFEDSERYPTLADVLERLKSMKSRGYSRFAQYRDTLLNRLESWLAIAPNFGAYTKGVSLETLAESHVVFEIRGFTERQGRFFISAMLMALFYYRMAQGNQSGRLRNLIKIDEAASAFPKLRNDAMGAQALASLMGQSRSAGLGLLLADQSPSDLDAAVMAHSNVKICFRLGSGRDLKAMGDAMALSDDQRHHLLKLDVGEAVASLPRLSPFEFRVPKVRGMS